MKSGDCLHFSLHVVWSCNEVVRFSLIFFTYLVFQLSTDKNFSKKNYPHVRAQFQKLKEKNDIYSFPPILHSNTNKKTLLWLWYLSVWLPVDTTMYHENSLISFLRKIYCNGLWNPNSHLITKLIHSSHTLKVKGLARWTINMTFFCKISLKSLTPCNPSINQKICTKIYQKQNKSVGHQTNTCNAGLLHVIPWVISLLLHAKI